MIGTRTRVPVSPNSLPQPGVLAKAGGLGAGPPATMEDALVLFELLSRNNTRSDQAWRPPRQRQRLQQPAFLPVSRSEVFAFRYDRATGWKPDRIDGKDAALELPARGASLPLRDVYRWTPLIA